MERITVQVGSVQAFEKVNLHAKVSGYLKTQAVDIGDVVEKDQVLATVDVPELQKLMDRNTASVALAKARVLQMKAKVAIAKADHEASNAQIVQTAANAKAAAAWVSFRTLQYQRMKDLFRTSSIEEKLVDEAKERHAAAIESENSARAAIVTSKAHSASMAAKIELAKADVIEAEAQVKVAQAELERIQVQLAFSEIHAPFDGIVTHRALFPGDFVRSAGEGGMPVPLLTIQRTDRMRVIVQIPDREVPYTDPGDPALVEIDALPGVTFPAKVSRIARAEDSTTRLMPVEIDLPNPKGRIRQGMFGRVTIILDKAIDQLSIPSSCLVGKAENAGGTVFVVRAGKVFRAKVRLGMDSGTRVEVLKGLNIDDEVVVQPPMGLADGQDVNAIRIEEPALARSTTKGR